MEMEGLRIKSPHKWGWGGYSPHIKKTRVKKYQVNQGMGVYPYVSLLFYELKKSCRVPHLR